MLGQILARYDVGQFKKGRRPCRHVALMLFQVGNGETIALLGLFRKDHQVREFAIGAKGANFLERI
jgi:hypothetical protein